MAQDLDQQVRQAVADFCRQLPRRYPFFSTVLGILLLILIIWFIPQWQVPESGLDLKERLRQINENRKTVAQIVGGVFILFGLYIAWVRSKAMRDQAEVDKVKADVEREKQLTDLYVKAIEQLGNDNIHIRLGGIYALERIARESPKDHWPIMEVLTAFVRENAPLKEEAPAAEAGEKGSSAALDDPEKTEPDIPQKTAPEKPPTDIQAILTVLGRTAIDYAQEGEKRSLDLRATHIAGADLRQAKLQSADLIRTNLSGADLQAANIKGAHLQYANLQEVNFKFANLEAVDLWESNLQGSDLEGANLREAILEGANLLWADFREATLLKAELFRANLKGACLRKTKGITVDQITETIWDKTTKWPEGFSPPPSSQGNKKGKG